MGKAGGINAVSHRDSPGDHLKPQGSTRVPLNSSLRVDATKGPTRDSRKFLCFSPPN